MNNKELDVFLNNLQDNIFTEAKESYGDRGFDRWCNPRFCKVLENADSHAVLTGSCGDTMEIFLKMKGDRVTKASYRTDGCGSSSICGSFAAELSIGKRADEILDMSGKTILEETGRFPKEEEHCAHLAITTLKEAINLYMKNQFLVKYSSKIMFTEG